VSLPAVRIEIQVGMPFLIGSSNGQGWRQGVCEWHRKSIKFLTLDWYTKLEDLQSARVVKG
jgi:hypothetical protein